MTAAEIRDDPQMAARKIFYEGTDREGRPFTFVGEPAFVDDVASSESRPAPELGEQTGEVLAELGYSTDEIEGFARDHVTTAAEMRTDHIALNVHGGADALGDAAAG